MPYKCEVRQQAAQPTLSIRTRTRVQDLQQALGTGYGATAQYLGGLQEKTISKPVRFQGGKLRPVSTPIPTANLSQPTMHF